MTDDAIVWAVEYALRGWPVFPVRVNRVPFTPHGLLDATTDIATIGEWWCDWPDAVPAIATGERSGVVALDIDVRDRVNGFDALDELGLCIHPETPTAHTPRGGVHVLFAWRHFVKTVAGKLGPGLDVRADRGSLMLPPGPGRWWDPHLGLDTPIAPMPEWMVIPEPEAPQPTPRPAVRLPLSRYGEAALDDAVKRITGAPDGQQHDTLNREVFAIGGLVAGGEIPSALAIDSLLWAARQMPSHDPRRPWREPDLDKMVTAAFVDGLRHPRQPEARR